MRMEVHAGRMREQDLDRALREVSENFAAVLGADTVARALARASGHALAVSCAPAAAVLRQMPVEVAR